MATLPPITRDGIKQLIAQLGADLNRVEESSASPPVKQDIRMMIGSMRNQLRAALLDSQDAWVGWVQDMASMFTSLSTQLQSLLDEPTGACHYSGGCIQSTKAQCDGLNGTFFPGTPC